MEETREGNHSLSKTKPNLPGLYFFFAVIILYFLYVVFPSFLQPSFFFAPIEGKIPTYGCGGGAGDGSQMVPDSLQNI